MVIGWLFFVVTEVGDGLITQRWRWRFVGPDVVTRTADRGFTTVVACWADAMQHGLTERDIVTIAARGNGRILVQDASMSATASCDGMALRRRATVPDKAHARRSSAPP